MGSNPGLAIFFLFFPPKWDKKWVLVCPNFGECTARVKLELTDFNVFVKMSILYCFKETYLLLHGLVTNNFFSKLSNVEPTKLNRFFQLCIAHIAWVSYELPSGVVFSNWKRWTELHKSHRGKTITVSVFLQCDLQL